MVCGRLRTIPSLDVSGDWLQFGWEESDWVFGLDEQNRADASWWLAASMSANFLWREHILSFFCDEGTSSNSNTLTLQSIYQLIKSKWCCGGIYSRLANIRANLLDPEALYGLTDTSLMHLIFLLCVVVLYLWIMLWRNLRWLTCLLEGRFLRGFCRVRIMWQAAEVTKVKRSRPQGPPRSMAGSMVILRHERMAFRGVKIEVC